MLRTYSIEGIGTATVVHPDGTTTVTKHNQILASFVDWAIDANLTDTVVARCKIGTGVTPNAPETIALEQVVVPTNGFPSATMSATNLATVVDGGLNLMVEGSFTFVFPVGAVQASIKEYGLDFRTSVDTSATVQTRVVLSPDDTINSIRVGEFDQLRIEYTLIIKAAVNQPEVPFEVAYSDGSKSQHTAQLIWNPLRTINWYLQPLIMAPSEVNYVLQKLSQKPINFNAIPGANELASVTANKGTLSKDGSTGVWSIPLTVPATSGNDPEGYNYLRVSVGYSIGGLPAGGWYINPPLIKNDAQSFSLTLMK